MTSDALTPAGRISLSTIASEWGRIGITGFGGPPAHIALLRNLCVEERAWLSAHDFEDGIAAVNLLPGPASTQLAIFCAWRLRGTVGAVVGGICFIVPGLILILGLSALFLASRPPLWVESAAAGAGAAVPVVALQAAISLIPASLKRAGRRRAGRIRWAAYFSVGVAAAAMVGPFLVLVLLACGLAEVGVKLREEGGSARTPGLFPIIVVPPATLGGIGALVWVAFKVGALSYGGGFVIVPLMQHDAVTTYHWMTGAQFLGAVALGQITPGPVVQTVAVVGYAAAGIGGGLLASFIAFAPSFVFVLAGGRHFDRLRHSGNVQAFLTGAGATAVGAIAGSAISLGLALSNLWQVAVLAMGVIWLVVLRKSIVLGLVGAGVLGVIAGLAGAPLPH